MIVFFTRRRARKLANQGKQRTTRTYVLLETRGDEMNPRDRELIQRRLIWAADLEDGLNERPRLKQARAFRDWANETLHIMEGMLPPDP